MIALHILKLLEEAGFGTIDVDLFYEKLTLQKEGLYITSRGAPMSRGSMTTQSFDIYARADDDIKGAKALEDVLQYLEDAYGEVCDLPILPGISTTEYKNCSIRPTSNISSAGLDAKNRIIYVISGQVQYNIN